MSKKTHDDKAVEKVADRDVQPTEAGMTWSDWFDHWPEMFARRWPESFRNMPFAGTPFGTDPFRLEQFVDDDGTMVVRAELPGIDPDDVEITISDGRMTISGEREEHIESDEHNRYRSEFRYGSFSRAVSLPGGAMLDDVHATYRDGILEVRVPIGEERSDVTKVKISTT